MSPEEIEKKASDYAIDRLKKFKCYDDLPACVIEDYISDAFIDGAKLCEPHVELLIACRGALEALNIYANEMHMRRLLAKIDALLKGEE